LSQFTRVLDRRTDGRTDGRTEFSSVKMTTVFTVDDFKTREHSPWTRVVYRPLFNTLCDVQAVPPKVDDGALTHKSWVWVMWSLVSAVFAFTVTTVATNDELFVWSLKLILISSLLHAWHSARI